MKKVYLSLFALALSLSALGSYAVSAPVSLFSDSFESGNFSNWTTADKGVDKWAVLPGILIKAQDGKRDAEVSRILKKPSTDWKLTKNISTVGYNNLNLSFSYLIPKLGHLESNDRLLVEYFDGSTWQKVSDITSTDTSNAWKLASYDLSTGANDNANFAFRLRAQFNPAERGLDALDTVIVDNVRLTGQAIPSTPIITAVSPSAFHQWAPSVYGNIVTWADYRSGKWEVYYRDLTKGEDIKIPNLNSSMWLNPVVDHRNIVYATEFSQAYIYNIDTKQTVKVSDSLVQQCPEISGNYVVWMDGRHSQEPGMQNKSDIYLKDLSSGEERSLSGTAYIVGDNGCPRVQGEKVVWSEEPGSNNHNSEIFMYDLATNQKTQITNAQGAQQDPDIYGDIIVWGDYRNATADQWYNSDIYMYDIATKQETQLTNNNAEIGTTAENSQLFQGAPAIYGNNIVYGDNTNDPVSGDVSKMNLVTKEITRVVNDSNITQSQADIYENTIVWMDYRSGVPNIYISR